MPWDRLWTAAQETVRRHEVLGDALLALGLMIISVGMLLIDPDNSTRQQPTASDIVASALSLLAITARRRFTVTALVASVVAANVFLAVGHHQQQPMLTAAISVLLYTCATHADRRTAWLTAGSVGVLVILAGWLWGVEDGDNLGVLAWIGMGTAIGDARRSQRAYVAEVEERALRAEQSRDDEARLRVAQERVRIARDLHDVVAHHIAVVKVQASGAKHVLAHRPGAVGPALDNIIGASDAVLREIASVVGLLRTSSGLTTGTADNEPAQGLAQLPQLIDYLASVGLRIEFRQVGAAHQLPLPADLAGYQIAREALTNAHKYGVGTIQLTLTYTEDMLAVDVTNTVGDRGRRRVVGYGIIGMRERATANGGSFQAARSDGCFAVHVELPIPAHGAVW
jgi:signal transduction histidine kinase